MHPWGLSGHAVQVAVARLVDAGVVRVDRSGTLTSTSDGGPTGRPLDDAALAALTALSDGAR